MNDRARPITGIATVALVLLATSCHRVRADEPATTQPATTQPAAVPTAATAAAAAPTGLSPVWQQVSAIVRVAGVESPAGYTITLPRDDVQVVFENGVVPPQLIQSRIEFFPCPCGKMNVVGQFAVEEFEVNDVIDQLRAGKVQVVSMTPMFLRATPSIIALRFQGEGGADALARTMRDALNWIGPARFEPLPEED